jgi:hypothetical protein
MVTFLWCHVSSHYYVITMVGWYVPAYALLIPYVHTHTHTLKYALYTPPSIQIHVFIYMNYLSLNPRPHGGIQMPLPPSYKTFRW